MDIGESLVGAYMRYVRGCEVVVYNTFLRGQQGEIDVVALKTEPRTIWLCEVVTHIQGMLYGGSGGSDATVERLRNKLVRAQEFAETTFPGEEYRFEVWSPRVAKGQLTQAFGVLAEELEATGMSLEFVVNEDYTACVRQLVEHARANAGATSEPAYRMLQVLTRLRDGRFDL